jgi:sensor histidine kinase regulating citrate/malate metabolism
MSDTSPAESPDQKAKAKQFEKLTMILAGGALVLSLVNTVLILLNPTAKKVEQFNEELKTELAESVASLHKKVDGLHTAEVEWQSVLKKAKDRPDATYKVVNTKDGYLTLTEIEVPETPPAK